MLFSEVHSAVLTCYDNPLRNVHHTCVSRQGLLEGQRPCLVLWSHLEGLRDSHTLADALSVLQLIMDAVHLHYFHRGGVKGWPTHPACRHIKLKKMYIFGGTVRDQHVKLFMMRSKPPSMCPVCLSHGNHAVCPLPHENVSSLQCHPEPMVIVYISILMANNLNGHICRVFPNFLCLSCCRPVGRGALHRAAQSSRGVRGPPPR